MLKTISAALLAASVLVVAPAMAHGPDRSVHAPGVGVVHVNPGVLRRQCQDGPPSLSPSAPSPAPSPPFPSSLSLPLASLKLIRGARLIHIAPPRLADIRPGPHAIASPMAGGPVRLLGKSGAPGRWPGCEFHLARGRARTPWRQRAGMTGCTWGYQQSARRSCCCRSRSRPARAATTAGASPIPTIAASPASHTPPTTAPKSWRS